MDFPTAVKTCFQKYVTFGGRAPRSEYWFFVLFGVLLGVIFGIIDSVIGTKLLTTIAYLVVLLPSIAVAVRRLHDINKSGWWVLISLIPIVGPIVLIIWYCTLGDAGPNRFGPDPLGLV